MSAPISLGIDFGGTSIKPGVVQHGRILARGNVIPTRQDGDTAALIQAIVQEIGYWGVTEQKSHIRKRSETNDLIFKYLQISGDVNKFTFAEDEQARDQPEMRWKEVFLVRF